MTAWNGTRCHSRQSGMAEEREITRDDPHYLPEIGRHSLEKIRRHNYYAGIFAKAMVRRWTHLVYIGLYAGAGRARIRGTAQIVETSAMAVLKQEVPFTRYILVDSDSRCIEALAARIEGLDRDLDVILIEAPVNEAVPQILDALPRFDPAAGETMLGLCFVDPFRVDLDFAVIRRLARFRMDFLVMLPLGFDLRRNLRRYLQDKEDERVGRMIEAPGWREEWRARGEPDRYFVRFALEKFDEAMERLGFRRREMKDTVSVKVTGMGVYLYSLALYTRHPLGEQFWKTTLKGTRSQTELEL